MSNALFQEQRRNKGFGRALLDSIEEIARFLQIPRLLLCSTDDSDTKVIFGHLPCLIGTLSGQRVPCPSRYKSERTVLQQEGVKPKPYTCPA